ncbi:MAG: anaerobic ribonucleoside-triphosphate reductase activating protein, partial [Candidatus Dojkabacteria bacterium]|nr:anaerobic ribonucleoside-triphosphate reductase activating protein [Candidatus Dojkabacteria bacterium]
MVICGLKKVTLIDYPEKIACTIFTHGCNLRCPFCHNPELVIDPVPTTNTLASDELVSFLKTRNGKLEGVVITGGEPLIHAKKLLPLLETIKALGFSIKIDTNGTFPSWLKVLIGQKLIDYIAMDFKTAPAEYDSVGASMEQLDSILESLAIIIHSDIPYEIRTTLVPGMHTLSTVANMMSNVSRANRFVLQNFVPSKTIDDAYRKRKSFSPKQMAEFLKIAK